MANITVYLNNIKKAIYGEEVRGSIHDAIKIMNDESTSAKQIADGANTKSDAAVTTANSAKQIADGANTKSDIAIAISNDAKIAAITAQNSASNSAEKAKEYADQMSDALGSMVPYIGPNNNWFVYDLAAGQYVDSGKPAYFNNTIVENTEYILNCGNSVVVPPTIP